MADAPAILYVGFAAQLSPLGTAWLRRTQVRGGRFWVFIWLVLWALMNAMAYIVAHLHYNNHFLSYIFTPIQGVAILWALSLFQVSAIARLTIRIFIPAFVAAWALALITIENVGNFSMIAEPVYSILALCTAVFTLVSRSNVATEPVTRQDWFWFCAGLALYFGGLTVLLPLAAATAYSRPDIITKAYTVDTLVNVLACACIAYGFLCSPSSIQPGSFSSPASSV